MAATVPVGRWVDIRDWLIGIHRDAVPMMQIFLYEVPPAQPHTYKWEIANLQLEGVGETASNKGCA